MGWLPMIISVEHCFQGQRKDHAFRWQHVWYFCNSEGWKNVLVTERISLVDLCGEFLSAYDLSTRPSLVQYIQIRFSDNFVQSNCSFNWLSPVNGYYSPGIYTGNSGIFFRHLIVKKSSWSDSSKFQNMVMYCIQKILSIACKVPCHVPAAGNFIKIFCSQHSISEDTNAKHSISFVHSCEPCTGFLGFSLICMCSTLSLSGCTVKI